MFTAGKELIHTFLGPEVSALQKASEMTSLGFYWTDWRVFSRVTSCDSQPVNTYVKLSLGDKNGLYTERNLPAPRKTSQKANYLEELYGKQLGDGWEVCVFLWVLIRESTRVDNARGGILRQIGKLDSGYWPALPQTRVRCFWVQPWWVYNSHPHSKYFNCTKYQSFPFCEADADLSDAS